MRYLLLLLLSAPIAHADEAAHQPFEFHAYARSNFQVANGLQQGSDDLNTGWGAHNRLQEGQYFELSFNARFLAHTSFKTTFSSGSTSYPYDNSIGASFFNVRNLYLVTDDVNGSDELWFGARMYRGDAIYIFDTWPLDDHDLIGGGYTKKLENGQMEYVLGVNKDSAFGVPGNSLAKGVGNPTFSSTTQRYLLIHKYERNLTETRKFKTNLEFQYIPKGTGTSTVAGSANNGSNFAIPQDYGIQAGAQANLWEGNTTVLNYGYGNVIGNWGSAYLNIVGRTVIPTSTTGVALADVSATSRKKAHAFSGAFYGTHEFTNWGLMYGWVPKYAHTADKKSGVVNTVGARPMYYLSERLHIGGEVDWITYPKRLKIDATEVAYVEVTPIVEYALARNAAGVPKFFVAASNAFYADKVVKNGRNSKYALVTTAGMELWF